MKENGFTSKSQLPDKYTGMSVTGTNVSADLSAKFPRSSLSGVRYIKFKDCFLRGEKKHIVKQLNIPVEAVGHDLLKEIMIC